MSSYFRCVESRGSTKSPINCGRLKIYLFGLHHHDKVLLVGRFGCWWEAGIGGTGSTIPGLDKSDNYQVLTDNVSFEDESTRIVALIVSGTES